MDNGISLSSCISGLACFSQKIQTSEYNIAKSEIETEESIYRGGGQTTLAPNGQPRPKISHALEDKNFET